MIDGKEPSFFVYSQDGKRPDHVERLHASLSAFTDTVPADCTVVACINVPMPLPAGVAVASAMCPILCVRPGQSLEPGAAGDAAKFAALLASVGALMASAVRNATRAGLEPEHAMSLLLLSCKDIVGALLKEDAKTMAEKIKEN